MSSVFIHRYSGILSAYGLALADVVHEAQEPCALVYQGTEVNNYWYILFICLFLEESFEVIDEKIDVLTQQCVADLERQGFKRLAPPILHPRAPHTPHTCSEEIVATPYLHLRYQRTDCALMVTPDPPSGQDSCNHGNYKTAFTCRYMSW